MGFGACLARPRVFDRYVDPSSGTNGSGTKASPHNSFSSIPSTVGLRVAIKRGTTMRGGAATWGPKATGWTIDSYGTGALPTVFGGIRLASFTLDAGAVWSCACATLPNQLIEMAVADVYTTTNLRWMTRVASRAALTAAGQWFYDTTNLRVYLWAFDSGNPSGHAYEAATTTQALQINNRAGTKLRNLRVFGGKYGVHVQNGGNGSSAGSCEFWCSQTGLFVDGSTLVSDFAAVGCRFLLAGADGGVKFYADVHDSIIEGCYLEHCAADPNAYQVTSGDPRTSTAAIANDSRASIWIGAHGDDLNAEAPGRTRLPERIKVYRNNVTNTAKSPHAPPSACPGTGIWADGPGVDIEIAWNDSHDGKSRGINVESGYFGQIRVHHNRVWNQVDSAAGGTGILVSRSATDVTVAYNTVYNCWQGFWAQSMLIASPTQTALERGDPGGFSACQWIGNIVAGCTWDAKFLYGAANSETGGNPATPEGTGNRVDRNLWDVDHASIAQIGIDRVYPSNGQTLTRATMAQFAADYNAEEAGGFTNLLQGDPQFLSFDPTSGDFLRIADTSPARNAGTAVAGITPPGVLTPDLGAIPYATTLPPEPPTSTGFGYGPFGSGAFGGNTGGFGIGPFGTGPFGGTP